LGAKGKENVKKDEKETLIRRGGWLNEQRGGSQGDYGKNESMSKGKIRGRGS